MRIVLDRSASMGIHGKLDQAVRLAAAIGFVAPAAPRHRDAAHRAGWRARRAGSPDATPPRPLFADARARSSAAGPTDLVGAVARRARPARTAPASPSSSPTCSTRAGTAPSTGSSPAAATRACSTCSPRRSSTPTSAAISTMVDVETGQEVPASLSPARLREYAEHVEAWLAETSPRTAASATAPPTSARAWPTTPVRATSCCACVAARQGLVR